jgi:uncharacterized protein (TIGR02421 family)
VNIAQELWGRHAVTGGELFLERPLPFLVLLRAGELEPREHALVSAEASRLVVDARAPGLAELLRTVLTALRRHAQRVLLVDVLTTEADSACGTIRICPHGKRLENEIAAFAAPLAGIDCIAGVELATHALGAPILDDETLEDIGVTLVEIQVPRIWRGGEDLEVHYPLVLRDLRAGFSRALEALCHVYARDFTEHTTPHPGAFGLKGASEAVREVDETLGRVAAAFSFLLACTPTNLQAAWKEFRAAGEDRPPHFKYRPLEIDPDPLRRALYLAPIERVDDPALEELFRDQRERLAEELTMLERRKTRQFLLGSLRLYGAVEEDLLELARGTAKMCRPAPDDEPDDLVGCTEFLRMAREELRHYIPDEEGVSCRIDDQVDSLIVDRGVLLVGRHLVLSRARARALVAHEVGTHLVTFLNAREQSLVQLRVGLPGYDELQEGLAVLAEHLVGALTPGRMRLLAARVVAVHALVEGADFVEIYRELVETSGLGKRLAFSTTTRVWRGGGLTKDAVYLRGIVDLLRHFNEGRSLEPLLVGKIAGVHLPLVEELMARDVIHRPKHVPRHFRSDEGATRIERLRKGATLFDLIDRSVP